MRVVVDRVVMWLFAQRGGQLGLGLVRWPSRLCHRLEVTFVLINVMAQNILN